MVESGKNEMITTINKITIKNDKIIDCHQLIPLKILVLNRAPRAVPGRKKKKKINRAKKRKIFMSGDGVAQLVKWLTEPHGIASEITLAK